MHKILVGILLAAGLSGCAAIQSLENIVSQVDGSTISPQNVYVAANAFDTLQIGVKAYFDYCRPHVAKDGSADVAVCSTGNRRTVIAAVRAGRAARNQLEVYLNAGTPAPVQVFNTLKAAVTALQSSAIQGVAK